MQRLDSVDINSLRGFTSIVVPFRSMIGSASSRCLKTFCSAASVLRALFNPIYLPYLLYLFYLIHFFHCQRFCSRMLLVTIIYLYPRVPGEDSAEEPDQSR